MTSISMLRGAGSQPESAFMIRLSDATLNDLPESVARPSYNRASLSPGIVHVGLGNFHRTHQAWYLHRLLELGIDHDWAIIGAGVRSSDVAQRDKLLEQDCLSTLIELDPSGPSAEVVGAMIDYVPVEEGNAALIRRMADPAIRIVALTVTESGYYIDPATRGFHETHPDIEHDAAHPDRPRTAFGAIVAALRSRRDQGIGPFTGLSCDNIQGNGEVLRRTVVSLARSSDPDLADWIDATCTFPNSMVDCITPATGPKELALAQKFGIEDMVPVTHESFRQWVIEDDFCAGRPDWGRVGVTFSDRVHDYETMKIRILNAGHQIIGTPGEILSIETVSDCMAEPLIHAMFRQVQREEILPHVAPVPEFSPEDYLELVSRRFSNPAVVDSTRRVVFDGSARHTGFVLPTVRDGLRTGTSVEGLALVEALWARMCEGTREDGTVIESNDPFWDTLMVAAKAARHRPRAWLEQRQFYGNLVDAPQFSSAFERWLERIWSNGCRASLRGYTAS
ncbi:MAG: mannitol dehydrogenase family protein [bacterium]|nr:mannitol dehydrogenase family protein [bacterium]